MTKLNCLTQQNKSMQSYEISNSIVKRKGTEFCFLLFCFLVHAGPSLAQNISLSLKQESIEKAFSSIEAQTTYRFIYSKETIKNARPVTLQLSGVSIAEALSSLFLGQPLDYNLEDTYIMVRAKPEKAGRNTLEAAGKVVDEQGNPLQGVNVTVKRTANGTTTNQNGEFDLKNLERNTILVFSYVGRETQEIVLNDRNYLVVRLKIISQSLDETIIQAYGTTTRRLSTGNISKVTSEEIATQPVSNPILALQGRVPGLVVTQSSGVPGASVNIQIRGQNSLIQGNDPLFVIDGIPFATGNNSVNQIDNATGGSGLSPFTLINPLDIESIEILKDADATAIYGSRGANGVILITTKKGIDDKIKVGANFRAAFSRVTRTFDMLNTKQYLQMRREAFNNDSLNMTTGNAVDLLVWDTTRYTDLKKLLIGGTANVLESQFSFSAGNPSTRFLINGSYHRETSVYPTSLSDQRASLLVNINHSSGNRKFYLNFNSIYSIYNSNLIKGDLTAYTNLPPNIQLYDAAGKLNWQEGGVLFRNSTINVNPLSVLNAVYGGIYQNLLTNLQLTYKLLPHLTLKTDCGINMVNGDESQTNPSSSLDPYSSQLPYAYFSNSSRKSWIAEPQIEWKSRIGKEQIQFLFGATWQENFNEGLSVTGTNYSSDLLLNTIKGAGMITSSDSYSKIKYQALFGRLNYNWKDKYIWNLSGRRDGSSKFGANSKYNTFGAGGFSWIFSKEALMKRNFSFLSFGKLRASYGITGNDQIGNYQFIDTWSALATTYQGVAGLRTTRHYNPDLEWEKNKKTEIGIDLGFINDRILFSGSWFNNLSSNQLVSYSLPVQTGFTSITKNLDAVIRNRGVELSINSKNIVSENFYWNSVFNITFPNNQLLEFPGLSTSSYANTYTIGESLSTKKLLQYERVNPLNGIYEFTDINNDGKLDADDRVVLIDTDPKYYGGLSNSIDYKLLQLTFFLEFKKQTGRNYLSTQGGFVPGYSYRNQPVIVLNRWQKEGDITEMQRFTASAASKVYKNASSYLGASDAIFSDASFIRLKTISFSCKIPSKLSKKIKLDQNSNIYILAQNAFTITSYLGADPENQNIYALPPLRTIAIGAQLFF
jgi:TonB-linked SusC/RagA family outer membrane protein